MLNLMCYKSTGKPRLMCLYFILICIGYCKNIYNYIIYKKIEFFKNISMHFTRTTLTIGELITAFCIIK